MGSTLYLLATDALQRAHTQAGCPAETSPVAYARNAIEAAAALVADPAHGVWVKAKWGPRYMERQNCFYRMLRVFAFTAHENLLRTGRYAERLRSEAGSLATEIGSSPHYLLEDYPGECYPTDPLWAVAAIRRADAVLSTDHSALASRLMRHFDGHLLTPDGMLPYDADALTGQVGRSSGCASSAILLFAAELDQEVAQRWYGAHERHLWELKWGAAGLRELPSGEGPEWSFQVDTGPVVAGFGTTATAFGCGAARVAGRAQQARALGAEMVGFSWPLPDGSLLVPRLLSDLGDAPLVGEAAVVFVLSAGPVGEAAPRGRDALPSIVWLPVAFGLTAAATILVLAWLECRGRVRRVMVLGSRRPVLAFTAWAVLGGLMAWAAGAGHPIAALTLLGVWHVLPDRIAGRG